ncbi:MAG: DEAD/DEAH box helicase [Rectinema sp.]|nr:DEAD/DEAH box helicase [Rectinema sp.]
MTLPLHSPPNHAWCDPEQTTITARIGQVTVAKHRTQPVYFLVIPGPWNHGWDTVRDIIRKSNGYFGNFGRQKAWRIPILKASHIIQETRRLANTLPSHTCVLDLALALERAEEQRPQHQTKTLIPDSHLPPSPEILEHLRLFLPPGKHIFPHQARAIELIHQYQGRVLLADDMGLGKSITALMYHMAFQGRNSPLLIIAPASVKGKWAIEVETWSSGILPPIVHTSANDEKIFENAFRKPAAFIISPDSIVGREAEIANIAPRTVIIDEAHYFKNIHSDRTRSLFFLMRLIPMSARIACSGTPMPNDARELFPLIRIIRPEIFGLTDTSQERAWREAYALWQERTAIVGMRTVRRAGKTITVPMYGVRDPVALYRFLMFGHRNRPGIYAPVMIRRRKSDIASMGLGGLPPKTRKTLHLAPESASNIELFTRDTLQTIRSEKDRQKQEALFSTLYMETGIAKIPGILLTIERILQKHECVVVFSHHHVVANGICDGLAQRSIPYREITGEMSEKERYLAAREFQEGQARVCVCTQAAREGIDLTRAHHLIIAERECVPYRELQAEDRIHRIGQQHPCVIVYLHLRNSIDDKLGAIIDRKKRDIESAIEGNLNWDPEADSSATILDALIRDPAVLESRS